MQRFLTILALIVAGEMVFVLPFHVARFVRPTMLAVFDYTNTQLGDLFAVYGITAAIAYFPGGALADRYSARTLLAASLAATAAGGLYMATIPGSMQMALLYGYWGVTTIFLFWGALIRATREWGGESTQGMAFGVLDAGRGLTAAVLSLTAVTLLAWYLPEAAETGTAEQRRDGLQSIIILYTAATLASAALVWFLIPASEQRPDPSRSIFAGIAEVLRMPRIWAQAGVIVAAYCGYKAVDNYSLYAVQVLGMDEVEGARLSSYGAYVRPIAALAAGFIADRMDATRSIGVSFVLLAAAYFQLSWLTPANAGTGVIIANLFVTLFAVFALRGIYFALLAETHTPRRLTGTAVGVVSFVGFTPEIFFGSIAGRILDASPGAAGHLDLFRTLGVVALVGAAMALWLMWLRRGDHPSGA